MTSQRVVDGTRVTQIDLAARMKDLRVSAYGVSVMLICLSVVIIEGFDIAAMAFAAPAVQAAWALSSTQMGILLAASVVGLGAGGILLTPAGDYLGRKPAMIFGLVLAAIGTAAGALAPGMSTMLVTRLVAGMGLGLAMPVTIALAIETMPERWRRFVVVIVMTGLPLGGMLGGMSSSGLTTRYGYQGIFLIGGAAALCSATLCLLALPESPYVLAAREGSQEKLLRVLRRLGIHLPTGELSFVQPLRETSKSTVAALFTPDRRVTTLLLWTTMFANLSMIYFFTNWLPTLFVAQNLPMDEAFKAVGIFNLAGAIGGVVLALSMTRFRPTASLAVSYLVSALGIIALVFTPGSHEWFYPVLIITGGAIVGSSFCLVAMVNQYYPASIRSTGAGYASGVGRIGSVFAPLAGGLALDLLQSPVNAFLVATVPALVALAAILALRRLAPETGASTKE